MVNIEFEYDFNWFTINIVRDLNFILELFINLENTDN